MSICIDIFTNNNILLCKTNKSTHMENKIIFSEDAVLLVCGHKTLIYVDLFGGMLFRGTAIVGYEIITQKQPGISYAYLEISEDMQNATMFDKEPTYNYQLGHYTSDGKKFDIGVEFQGKFRLEIPKNRLFVLRVKEDQNCWV